MAGTAMAVPVFEAEKIASLELQPMCAYSPPAFVVPLDAKV